METFEVRLSSFSKPKSKSSKSFSARAWPHPGTFVATPTTLAEAGFFFKPSKDDPDNVQCFICKKELGGWDEDDNPFDIHVKKCPKCPWAIARCSLEFDVDSDGSFSITDHSRMPTNKTLEKARADTFGGKKWWPHDAVKNHGANSKKMAKAGFVFTPQVEGDDTATCFYCDLSLSGWDAEDDPAEEHIKRVERSGKPCPFFQATERPKSVASTKSTKSNSRKSKAAKKSDRESDEDEDPIIIKAPTKRGKQKQDEAEKVSRAPPKLSDTENSEELEEDDPSLKVQPVPVPRKSSRKPASKSKPASKTTTKRNKQRMPTPSDQGDETDGEIVAKPSRSRTKSGKANGKEQAKEKTKDKEKDSDKPPSNVDGKIAKSYEDFTIDINAVEEAKEKRKTSEARRGRGDSRGRSRSKSKPRSTSASSFDPQSKPLLRASSRSRISGLTEMEEMETEKMLAEPPSETEPEIEVQTQEELLSDGRRKTHDKKDRVESDAEDFRQQSSRSSSRAQSVTSEKATGKANRQGKALAKTTSVRSTTKSGSSKSAKSSSRNDEVESDVEVHVVADDPYMDIDAGDEQAEGLADTTIRGEPHVDVKHSRYPAPMSPSDFKTFPSKPGEQTSSSSKPTSKSRTESQSPKLSSAQPFGANESFKSIPEKTKASQKKKQASLKQTDKQVSRMDLDEIDAMHSRSQEEHTLASSEQSREPNRTDTKATSPRRTPEPYPRSISRPVTPENQIIRHAPRPNENPDSTDFRSSLHVSPSPADLFLPPLTNAAIQVIAALTEEERAMTVEQWIRHEMAVQYQRLKEDGERRIRAFLEEAEETRRQIEAL